MKLIKPVFNFGMEIMYPTTVLISGYSYVHQLLKILKDQIIIMGQLSRENEHVLIIDEDASSRNGLLHLLRVAGYKVKAYECAADFLVDLDQFDTGCIILDTDLTGMSGDDLISRLKALCSHLPMIIISSSDDQSLKRESWIARAKGFYRKPVDGRALIDAIDWQLIHTRKKVTGQNETIINI